NTPGVDGMTVRLVEQRVGVREFLDDLRAQLKAGTFRPLPVRPRLIPQPVRGAQRADPQAGRVGEAEKPRHPRRGRQGGPGRAEARAGTHLRGGLRARLLPGPACVAGAAYTHWETPLQRAHTV